MVNKLSIKINFIFTYMLNVVIMGGEMVPDYGLYRVTNYQINFLI